LPDFRFGNSGFRAVVTQISLRLTDFGEVLLNASAAKFGPFHRVVFPAGLLLLMILCTGLWQARRRLRPTHIYLLTYFAILAIWPYADARFWIPVLPLVTLIAFQVIAPSLSYKFVKNLVVAYLVCYGVLALIAIAFTTRISFSGDRFEAMYGSEVTRAAYEQARSGRVSPENATFVRVLRRYGAKGGK
jgi:hypothetical protein